MQSTQTHLPKHKAYLPNQYISSIRYNWLSKPNHKPSPAINPYIAYQAQPIYITQSNTITLYKVTNQQTRMHRSTPTRALDDPNQQNRDTSLYSPLGSWRYNNTEIHRYTPHWAHDDPTNRTVMHHYTPHWAHDDTTRHRCIVILPPLGSR